MIVSFRRIKYKARIVKLLLVKIKESLDQIMARIRSIADQNRSFNKRNIAIRKFISWKM